MTADLARRALRELRAQLGCSSTSNCTECHCTDCLRAGGHRCSITRLLDDLAVAARAGRSTVQVQALINECRERLAATERERDEALEVLRGMFDADDAEVTVAKGRARALLAARGGKERT